MSEDKFNALILIHVHPDIKLDYNKIIDMYADQHPGRMLLKYSMLEQ